MKWKTASIDLIDLLLSLNLVNLLVLLDQALSLNLLYLLMLGVFPYKAQIIIELRAVKAESTTDCLTCLTQT